QIIDFRPRGRRRLDQLLLDLFLNALEPALGMDSAVLRAFDLRFEPIDPIFGGPQLLPRSLQHLDDGAAGPIHANTFTARLPRCESEHLVGYAGRALAFGCAVQVSSNVTCRVMHGAQAPGWRSCERRGIHATEHQLELPKLEENVLD